MDPQNFPVPCPDLGNRPPVSPGSPLLQKKVVDGFPVPALPFLMTDPQPGLPSGLPKQAERQKGRKAERQKGRRAAYQDTCAFFVRLGPHPRQYLAVTEVKAIWQQGRGCTNEFPSPLPIVYKGIVVTHLLVSPRYKGF